MVCHACYYLQVVLCLLTKCVCQPKVQGTKVCIERLIHLRHHKRFKNLSCESILLPSHHSHRKRCKYCRAPHQLTVYAVRYGARCNSGPVQTISSSQSSHVQSTWQDLERLHQPETTVKSMPSGFVNPRRIQDGNAITCDNWSAWVASYLSGLCGCCMASATLLRRWAAPTMGSLLPPIAAFAGASAVQWELPHAYSGMQWARNASIAPFVDSPDFALGVDIESG